MTHKKKVCTSYLVLGIQYKFFIAYAKHEITRGTNLTQIAYTRGIYIIILSKGKLQSVSDPENMIHSAL